MRNVNGRRSADRRTDNQETKSSPPIVGGIKQSNDASAEYIRKNLNCEELGGPGDKMCAMYSSWAQARCSPPLRPFLPYH